MMNRDCQGKGIGTELIGDCVSRLKENGFGFIRLAYAKGNRPSEVFWLKNGFVKTGKTVENEGYTAVLMQREL